MNREEARVILEVELDEAERLGYDSLAPLVGTASTFARTTRAGTKYQLELQFFWDDKPEGAVRVLGSIDDGSLRSLVPLTDSRTVSPVP